MTPSIRDDGRGKIMRGETTIEEVLRVTQIEEHMDTLGGDMKTEMWVKS